MQVPHWVKFVAAAAAIIAVFAYSPEQNGGEPRRERPLLRVPGGPTVNLDHDYVVTTERLYRERQRVLARQFSSNDFAPGAAAGRFREGGPFARLQIPSLDVDLIVAEGVSGDVLRSGAGHYPSTAAPGRGNIAIAGHRTGFGQPFRNLDRLRAGETAILSTPAGRFIYEVMEPFDGHPNPWITEPLDWTPIAPTNSVVMTLTTTDPPHTSERRLIVRFRLVGKR